VEPTTVAACDAALADLSRMLRVAYDRTDMDAEIVLHEAADRVLDIRSALTKPRVKVGAP
jgi:hypothetical protein